MKPTKFQGGKKRNYIATTLTVPIMDNLPVLSRLLLLTEQEHMNGSIVLIK